MPDVQEVFRMATQKVRPEPGFVERQQQNQRHRMRNRKIGAFAVAASIGMLVVMAVIRAAGDGTETRPAIQPTPTPPKPAVTTREVDFLLDLETGGTTPLPKSIRGDGYAVSPDGSKVAYFVPPQDGSRLVEIFVAHLDGTHVRQITHGGVVANRRVGNRRIGWSPDGTKIAYVRRPSRDVNGEIFVIDLASGATTQVTSETVDVSGAQFSPDGSSIIYTANLPDGSEVRIVPATGGKGSRLVGSHGSDASGASLSPDGALLSYICGGDLCLANADGSDPRVIAEAGGGQIRTASWSPDGSRLAYWTFFGDEGVWVIDVVTGEEMLVAQQAYPTPKLFAWPEWVDDHTLIVEIYSSPH